MYIGFIFFLKKSSYFEKDSYFFPDLLRIRNSISHFLVLLAHEENEKMRINQLKTVERATRDKYQSFVV